MLSRSSSRIGQLLAEWGEGDRAALDALIPTLYAELRRVAHRHMRRELPGQTLQTSALVHEAYLRLVDQRGARCQDRGHFLALASKLMRRILVDRARSKGYAKRGGHAQQVSLNDGRIGSAQKSADVLALDDALKDLEAMDERKGHIVEMRFFGGLSLEETAEALGISVPTVEREWRAARAWLHRAMTAVKRDEA
jgi:RNA polymerase sigma-70 factor, ECF subfamily